MDAEGYKKISEVLEGDPGVQYEFEIHPLLDKSIDSEQRNQQYRERFIDIVTSGLPCFVLNALARADMLEMPGMGVDRSIRPRLRYLSSVDQEGVLVMTFEDLQEKRIIPGVNL